MCHVSERLLQDHGPLRIEPGVLTPLQWPDWHARIRSLEVDGARADYVEYDPYLFDVPPMDARPEGPIRVMLVVILAGSSIGTIDGAHVNLAARQAVLINGRAELHFRAPEPMRAVRLFVSEDHLPQHGLDALGTHAVLKDSPLVNGVVGLISGLLQVSSPTVDPRDAAAVSQPLVALQASLLDEALHRHPTLDVGTTSTPDRREVIAAYIDAHLADPDLTVGSIAAALQLSTRSIHAAYSDSSTTAAEDIRQRRVSRAQALLALRDETPNIGALARRVGLQRDQLGRAFRATTGLTVLQWWTHQHQHQSPAPRSTT